MSAAATRSTLPARPRTLRWTLRRPAVDAAAIADALVLASVLLLFTISPNALFALGSSYGLPGGNALTKFHPGTLASLLALGARMMAVGPRRSLELMLGRFPAALLGAVASSLAVLYVAAILRMPVTPAIETFVLPVALFAAIVLRTEPLPALAPLLHAVFALNALLGLGEFATHLRLTPFVAGVIVVDDWRSTALFGHPLANAMLVAAYMAALVFGRLRGLPAGWRVPALILQGAAMVVFGGRIAIVLTAAILAGAALLELARLLAGRRLRPGRAAAGIGVALVLGLAVAVLLQSGFFDLLAERFVHDEGSANTRVVMFRIFEAISAEGLWLGPDPDLVDGLMQREGIEYGVESFPVALTLLYGLVVSALLMGGLAAFLADLVKATRPASAAVIAVFLLIAASSTSLAAKTVIVTMVATMLLAFYAPGRGYRPRRAPRPSGGRAA